MQERYERNKNQFWVVDQELEIELSGEITSFEKDHYTSGQLRYQNSRKGEALHGPSIFYNESGKVISETWYFEGEKVGKVRRYYPTGQLYSLERFVDGEFHLAQEYYFLDGSLKTITHYKEGQLHGETKLFWPDGTLKRHVRFIEGVQDGEDQIFDEEGRQIGQSANPLS